MLCRVYGLNELTSYKYVVVLSVYNGKIMLSRHKNRTTWETQGGHIEKDEIPLDAAKRELYEESGAVEFTIAPAFDYCAGDANGIVFIANIEKIGSIPESEMQEIRFFDELPDDLTYPEITPVLFEKAKELIRAKKLNEEYVSRE